MNLRHATRRPHLALAVLGLALASCSQPATTVTQQPAPDSTYQTDRNAAKAPPVSWDDGRGAFVQNGKPLAAGRLWRFAGSTDGFTAPGTIAAAARGGGLTIQNKLYGAFIRTPNDLGLDGRRY